MLLSSWMTTVLSKLAIPVSRTNRRRRHQRLDSTSACIESLETKQLLSAGVLTTPVAPPPPQPILSGPETQVNSHTSGDQSEVRIASDAAGDYVVVWVNDPNGVSSIFAQRYTVTGVV